MSSSALGVSDHLNDFKKTNEESAGGSHFGIIKQFYILMNVYSHHTIYISYRASMK